MINISCKKKRKKRAYNFIILLLLYVDNFYKAV